MSRADRTYWDQRWTEIGPAPVSTLSPDPPHFAELLEFFPRRGWALDVACGRGRGTAWLAQLGLTVTAVDVSPVAIDLARRYVSIMGIEALCTFAVADLDLGMPVEGRFELVFSSRVQPSFASYGSRYRYRDRTIGRTDRTHRS